MFNFNNATPARWALCLGLGFRTSFTGLNPATSADLDLNILTLLFLEYVFFNRRVEESRLFLTGFVLGLIARQFLNNDTPASTNFLQL